MQLDRCSSTHCTICAWCFHSCTFDGPEKTLSNYSSTLFFDTRRASRAAKIGIIRKLQSNLHALGLPETKPETQHRRYRVRGSRCHRVGRTHCATRSQVPHFTYIIPPVRPSMTLTLRVLCSQTQTSTSGANPRFSSRPLSTWRPRRGADIVRTDYCRARAGADRADAVRTGW